MSLHVRSNKIHSSFSKTIAVLCFALLPSLGLAQQRIDVALVTDGTPDRLEERNEDYIDELLALTSGEFDVRIREFSGDWSIDSIGQALDQAYADPQIDMVLVTGFTSNQVAAGRSGFPKPTFLPVMLDVGVLPSQADHAHYRNHRARHDAFIVGWQGDVRANGDHDHVRARFRHGPDTARRAGAVFVVFPCLL